MRKSIDQREKLLCQLLRESLEKSGMSQRELAIKLSKNQSYIYKVLFHKRKLSIVEFLDWCVACEIPWVSLLEKVVTPSKPSME